MKIDANELILNPSLVPGNSPSKIPFCTINKRPQLSDFYSDTVEAIYIKNKSFLPLIAAYIHCNGITKIYVDTETDGLDPYSSNLILIQIYAGDKIFLINVDEIGTRDSVLPYYNGIKLIMKSDRILKGFQNGKFDIKFLSHHLFGLGAEYQRLYDTYLAEKLITAGIGKNGEGNLQFLTKKYVGIELDKNLQTSFKSGVEPSIEQLEYGLWDVLVLETIHQIQREILIEENLTRTASLEFAVIPIIAGIELNGMLLDREKLDWLRTVLIVELYDVEQEMEGLIKDLNPEYGKNLEMPCFNSPKQMIQLLNDFGFEVTSSAAGVLSRIDHPFAQNLMEYRKLSKLLSSFARPLPEFINKKTGRIHQSIFQLGTVTGRTSSSSPNLQQMPKKQKWRDLFIAQPGWKLITADYSQIELRILAEYSQDPKLLDAFHRGLDLHAATASEIFWTPIEEVSKWQRDAAKVINFGLVYGMSPFGLAGELGIGIRKAKNFIDRYFAAYPLVYETLEEMGAFAVENQYSVTLLGRKRFYTTGSYAQISRKGKNSPIQGSCGDILKMALLLLEEELRPHPAFIVNLVHDEVIVEVESELADVVGNVVRSCMVEAGEHFLPSVPVMVDMAVDTVWQK